MHWSLASTGTKLLPAGGREGRESKLGFGGRVRVNSFDIELICARVMKTKTIMLHRTVVRGMLANHTRCPA